MKQRPWQITRLLAVLLLFVSTQANASHIVGLELYYTWVSGSTYKISLVAYGDCGPASASAFSFLSMATPTVCVYDGATPMASLTLAVEAPATGVEITPVCPRDSLNTQCTNMSNPIPGIKKFVYSTTYTVPHNSTVWQFIFEGELGGGNQAGRAAAITNVLAGTTIQLVDTLNNTLYNNSSPIMTTVPTPFFCLNNNNTYNPGAVDPDNDSLSFSLVQGMAGTANCSVIGTQVTYTGAYSGAAPLSVAPGMFSLDGNTGQVTFFPNIIQRALVVYNVREFRGGQFVGSCQREMTFLVLTCTNIPPSGSINSATAGTIANNNHFYICKDSGDFSIFINPTAPDTTNTITVSISGLTAGSTFNVIDNGTNHPKCTFKWTSNVPPGNYIFYLTFKDNACPLSGSQTNAFTITVLPLPIIEATGGHINCVDPSATLTANGATTYSWSPVTGLSCPECRTTEATGYISTIYTVTGTDTNGCRGIDTTNVTLAPDPPVDFLHSITSDQAIPYGKSIQLSVYGGWRYNWNPPNGTLNNANISNPIATPLEKTTYTVFAFNETGCRDTAQVTIDVITSTEVIPTAFTPNGDGLNDYFRVINLRYGRLVEMRIFNRWGEEIFRTIDNELGWNGTYRSIPQDLGVYNYSILIERENREKVFYKGEVTLVR